MITPLKLTSASLLMTLVGSAALADDITWDISDTGQPSSQATISVTGGTWISIDVSPDGATLVFDILGDIYTMPAGGGNATLIRGGPAFERQPRYSPDGSLIAFISDKSGADNIWIADLNGDQERKISNETTNKVTNPDWTADGQYIAGTRAGTSMAAGFGTDIGLYHIGGSTGRTLIERPKAMKSVGEAAFSSDGKYVYYSEDTSTGATIHKDPNQPVYAVKRKDLSSGETEQIMRGYGSATAPQVSPDSARIAFVRRVRDKSVLFVRDLASGRETPVHDGLGRDGHVGLAQYGYYPHFGWFPDNRHVAIWGRGKLLKVDVDAASVEEIPFQATAIHTITDVVRFSHDLAPAQFKVQSIRHVATSPDGRDIVFSALGHLWKKDLPDGQPRRLTQAHEFEFEPSWSPDGRSIAYIAWDDEQGAAIRTVSARGGKGKTTYAGPGILRAPSWSPGGDTITYFVDLPNDLMGGYRAKEGIYHVPVKGGQPAFVIKGKFPTFAADGERIFYHHTQASQGAGVFELHSIRPDGLDDRNHAKSTDAYEYRLSPDQRWLSFRQQHNVYVMPYAATGDAINVNAVLSTEVTSVRVSKHAGWNAHFSADSQTLHWMLGDEYYSARMDELFPWLGSTEAGPLAFEPTEQGLETGLIATSDVPVGSIVFINANIIAMDGSGTSRMADVLIEGNRITAVGGDFEFPVGDTTVIDLKGKTLMPGLIDMHGHLTLYRAGLSPQKHAPYYAAVAYGVTTNFDPSSTDHATATNTELLRAGLMVGPRYIGTGAIIYGISGTTNHVPINSLEDARSAIRRKQELGSITLKSYMQPMRQQRQQIIKAAREREMMVMPEGELHFYNQLTMILDGHTTIEHNNPMGMLYDDVIQLLANSGTALTPTLIVTSGETFGENYFYQTTRPWEDPKAKMYIQNTLSMYSPLGGGLSQPPHVRGMISIMQDESLWEIGVREAARALKRASDAGVLVNTGAHGQIQGLGMHWEMWLFAMGGMSEIEVLRAATMNPATTLGMENQIGSIEVGKLADLIVLDGNPLEDIRNTNTVRYTMVNGRLFDSVSMNEIGNYDRPRTKFFWELPDYNDIDWNESYQADDQSIFSGHPPERH